MVALRPILYQHCLACFVAATCKEPEAWLNCLPCDTIGCRLDNDSFCLVVTMCLGLRVCTSHRCRCGSKVDKYGLHPLSCRFSISRLPRHTALNDIIRRSLQSASIPTLLESAGLECGDGIRPDGITLLPYTRGCLGLNLYRHVQSIQHDPLCNSGQSNCQLSGI